MKWYDLLITDEFIDYFCNESNIYYTDFKNEWEYTPQPLFKKFCDTVKGITTAFERYKNAAQKLLILKETEPDFYNALINCEKVMPPNVTLGDFWQSIDLKENRSPYQVDVESLEAEQIAVLILYRFWRRMGVSTEIYFLDSGNLKKYLLELKKKSKQ